MNLRRKVVTLSMAATTVFAGTKPVNPPLFTAVEKGDLAKVRELVEHGENPNTIGGPKEWSLLQIAAAKPSYEIVKFLVEHGANINYKSKGEATPIGAAIGGGDLRIIDLLLQKGAKVELKGHNEMTPLHWAAAVDGDRIDIFDRLLKSGANIDAKAEGGVTVLMFAVGVKNLKILRRIVELRPAMVNVAGEDGFTPASWAAKNHLDDVEKILRSAPCP